MAGSATLDSSAAEDNLMVLDSSPLEVPKQSQLKYEDVEKRAEKRVHLVTDEVRPMNFEMPEADNLGLVVLNKVSAENLASLEANGDAMNVEASKQPGAVTKDQDRKKANKTLKRKRAAVDTSVLHKDKETLALECHQELNNLFEYYKEFTGYKLNYEESPRSSINSLIACLVEESNLPFSKLADEVYEKLKVREGVTLASIRSSVLSVAQRMMYGVTNADADVLEDESPSCLWCWEVREMKLLNKNHRNMLNVRRIGRRKIHERISALSATLSALSAPECRENYKADLIRASTKLGKTLNWEGIVSLLDRLKQKNESDMSEKESKLKEKASIIEKERSMKNAEKEKQRIEREIQREKLQTEKEIKRLQDEAVKEEKRREKEELELKKQLKRQQDEAERDQKRREKEETEKKRQLAIQKQASVMQRFLKSKKSDSKLNEAHKETLVEPKYGLACKEKVVVNATTSTMDCIFSKQGSLTNEDLRSLHLASWHELSHYNRSCRWGVRRKPKSGLCTELKLQGASSEVQATGKPAAQQQENASFKVSRSGDPSLDKLVDVMEFSESDSSVAAPSFQTLHKKLLQFDKSHRPAYYGTWPKKSGVIGPRCPFNKDPNLDYDVDSDEEWEEDEPGESLSDCDKDNEDEYLEEKCSKADDDDDDTEDDFVVPDGYLSENEGVQVDGTADDREDEGSSLPKCTPEAECEDIKVLLQQQKHLRNFTDQALRKGHPLIISNLTHEKSTMLMPENLEGANKVEHICLQALCMQTFPEGPAIIISIDQSPSTENHDVVVQSQGDNIITPPATVVTISDSDFSEFVSIIRLNPYGINKVVESLQTKFPNIPKCHLRNKIREISNFVDNRWQVKKEILEKLGLSTSPGTTRRRRGIATYFTKRCLPPEGKAIESLASQPCSKVETHDDNRDHCSYTDI